jgi:hypothetical protein
MIHSIALMTLVIIWGHIGINTGPRGCLLSFVLSVDALVMNWQCTILVYLTTLPRPESRPLEGVENARVFGESQLCGLVHPFPLCFRKMGVFPPIFVGQCRQKACCSPTHQSEKQYITRMTSFLLQRSSCEVSPQASCSYLLKMNHKELQYSPTMQHIRMCCVPIIAAANPTNDSLPPPSFTPTGG